ncbi:MAG: hypothetical protein M3Q51_04030 [Pseudomonadota bacterium]|nr:hypothetical protein [Pseudomonadota bacterium]
MRHHMLAMLCACSMLAACGSNENSPAQQQSGDEALPQPVTAGGSVTGMPNPGAPSVRPPPVQDPANYSVDEGFETDAGNGVDPDYPITTPETDDPGEIAIPPVETMPTMPAPVPDPVESRIAPPPEP